MLTCQTTASKSRRLIDAGPLLAKHQIGRTQRDRGLDPDRLPVTRDRLHVQLALAILGPAPERDLEALAVLLEHAVRSGRPAGLLEQRPSTVLATGRRRQVLDVGRAGSRHPAVQHPDPPVQDRVVHPLPVDRHQQGPSNPDVAEDRSIEVQPDDQRAGARSNDDLVPTVGGVPLELRQQIGPGVAEHRDLLLAGLRLREHRVAVGRHLHHERRRTRWAGPVARVRLEDDVLVRACLLQSVRSGVDRLRRVLALEQLGRRDAAPEMLRIRLADAGEVWIERAGLEDELSGQRIGRPDLVDLAHQRAVDQREVRRALQLEGEGDVGRGQRRAVLPDEPLAQAVGHLQPPSRHPRRRTGRRRSPRVGTSRASLGTSVPSASGITSQSPVSASTLLRLLQPFGTPQNRLAGRLSWVAVMTSARRPPADAV